MSSSEAPIFISFTYAQFKAITHRDEYVKIARTWMVSWNGRRWRRAVGAESAALGGAVAPQHVGQAGLRRASAVSRDVRSPRQR